MFLEKPAATKVKEIYTSILNMVGTGVTWWGGGQMLRNIFPTQDFFLATELKRDV